MSLARKCDRCGNCFDAYAEEEEAVSFTVPCFRTGQNYKDNTIGRPLIKGLSPDSKIDLCPVCSRLFEMFMCGSQLEESPISKKYRDYLPKNEDVYIFDFPFSTREKAETVLDNLEELLVMYATVSVGDIYDLAGQVSPYGYRDFKYGWRDLAGAKVIPVFAAGRVVYKIVMPRQPILLIDKEDGDTDGDC